jgi:hypothetical protein
VNFDDIMARYNAAFDTYNEFLNRNVQRALTGEQPSAADIERESKALAALNEARRELLAALDGPQARISSRVSSLPRHSTCP